MSNKKTVKVPSIVAAIGKDKPTHPMTQIENVSLEKFESAVYKREYETASQLLLEGLRRLRAGAEFIGYSPSAVVKPVLYTRFCAAIISLLADPKFMLSEEGLAHVASEHAMMDMVFRASIYGSSDHLLPHVTVNPEETNKNDIKFTDGQSLMKFLATYSLRSAFNMNFEQTFAKAPQHTFAIYLGMMSHMLTIDAVAQDRREKLNSIHKVFEGIELTDSTLPILSDTYMYSSYCISPDKHGFKSLVHKLLAKKVMSNNVPLPSVKELQSRLNKSRSMLVGKPVMVIGIEWFTSMHAMYRCWMPSIRQLRKRFYLIGIGQATAIDDTAKTEFDEWVMIPQDNIILGQIISDIEERKPDIIYMPSCGMTLWWVTMASLRLAPIQVITLGHPATTMSSEVDYCILEEGSAEQSDFSEKLVFLPKGSFRHVMRPDATFPEPLPEVERPEVIKVMIPAMLCKLNAPFMAACKRIHDKATELGQKVEFHFFINMIGLTLFETSREIQAYIPGAFVYERMQYNDYIRFLQNGHLHLSTFPFGGTNSNIDSFHVGLPVITLYGQQPHERFDAIMMRALGLPEELLIAKSVDDYVDKAVDMIMDHVTRNKVRRYLLEEADIDGTFFGELPPDKADNFVEAMWNIYQNHNVTDEYKRSV